MFELGDPVHFEDEQANAGQSQEQEHANSLMVEMVRMMIADIYISISMGTFEHRKYKSRGEDGNK